MGKDRPFAAAARLRAAGVPEAELVERLCAEGHARAEALVAVRALPSLEVVPERSSVELHARELRDRGYLSMLFAAALLGGGLLFALGVEAWLGGAAMALGAALLASGLFKYFRGSLL